MKNNTKHTKGTSWVLDLGDCYGVYTLPGVGYSKPDSFYSHDKDGLSIAIARCNYLGSKR